MTDSINRRDVVQGAAAAAAVTGLATSAQAQPGRPYRVGVIGAGWFGKLDVNSLMAVAPVEVLALCDVDSDMLEQARELTFTRTDTVTRQRRRPAIYSDYRRMLSRHNFDIVIVATPDHWHALPAIAAVRAGAHVYVEKPISVDIVEGQAMVAAARRHNRVVISGTQRRVSPAMLEAKRRVIDSGLIGKIGHVDTYCYYHQRRAEVSPPSEPPANLDWDAYCGPAPLIPYRAEIHPNDWRSFKEFGNGYLGDVGVHMIDTVRWLAGLGWPKRVSSLGGITIDTQSAASVPDTQTASFEYENLIMTWTNRHWGNRAPGDEWGASLYGERGVLRITSNAYEFTPYPEGESFGAELQPEFDRFPQDREYRDWEWPLAKLTRHNMIDFVNAIEGGSPAAADVEEGHISTAHCVLANLSLELGRPLAWDGAAQRVINDEDANARLARAYRAPWEHPIA
jgi:predicted dehydrogenase